MQFYSEVNNMFSSLSFIFAHHLIRSFEWMNSWKVCVHESSAKNQIKNFGERAKRSFDIFWLDLHSFSSEANPPKNLFYLSKWNMKWAGTKLIICVPLNLKIKEPFEIPSCIILWLTITCNWIFMCLNQGTLEKCGLVARSIRNFSNNFWHRNCNF